MISSQSEQRLLAAEIDTSETSAPSTPEPFASHLVKIPGINSRQEDADSPAVGADSRRLSTIGTLRYTSSFEQNSGPGGSARITGADPSAGSTTHGNIASRRAMRM
ncbi:hypothetical protein I306_02384, partial [Cryptococcus gattii EJB2]